MECSVSLEIEGSTSPSMTDGPAMFRPLGMKIWTTSSGRRVRHTVYSLVGCPGLTSATYVLVRRTPDGRRSILAVRRTRSVVPSLNLARIRRAGARRGANEVHVYRGARTDGERIELVADLTRALRRLIVRSARAPRSRHL